MNLIFYIELPTETLHLNNRLDHLAAAKSIMSLTKVPLEYECYNHDDEYLGLRISINGTEKFIRHLVFYLQQLPYPVRGALSEKEITLDLPGYEFSPYVSNTYKPPRPKRPPYLPKYHRVIKRPAVIFGPCPTCGLMTVLDPFYVNRKRSHVIKCKAKHDARLGGVK